MVFMYTLNAKAQDWWKEVTLVVWGPSAKLLAQDEELQTEIKKMKNAGVTLLACKACADSYWCIGEFKSSWYSGAVYGATFDTIFKIRL